VGEKEEKPADLTHLEEEFFTDRSEAFGGDVKNLFLTACTTCELEAEEIARKIRQLVKNGVRYRDIGLLVGSVPAYESAVLRAFRRYDIPVFIDRKRSLLQDPLAEFALSALVAVGKKYPAESVLTYMKTGLTGLSADETEKLENYIVAYRVGGHGFTRPFYKGKEDLLTEMEPLRLRLMEPLMTLEKSLRDANTAQALARGLWEFLDRMDFSRRAENLSAMLQEMGYPEEASISSRVHNLMADVLDKMVDIFGDTPLSVLEFSDLFEAGLDGLEVGLIPQRSDEVLFGDTLRTKLLGKDYIFAAGFNEDWVPSNPAEGALLSDEELSELRAGGIDLPFDRAYERAREALSLYNLLTGAEKGLYVSYALSDGAGAVRYPSPYIKKLKNTYPNLEEKVLGLTEPDRAEKLAAFRSKEAAFEELCRRLRQVRNGEEIDPLWWSVYRALLADAEYGAKTKSLGQDLILPNQPKNLSKETMLSLMKRGLTMSISQMEKYRACPYAYFIHYGIRPQVMKEFEVEPVDVGTFLHSVVELFFDAVKEKGLDIATIDDRTIEELVAAAAEEALRRDSSHLLTDSSRNSYIYKKLCRVALKDIRILIDHLKHSDFEPFGQEIDFGGRDGLKAFEVTLQDGSRVKIIGKVDRLDMLRQENRVYVETIDYKSGRKDTDLKEILEGRHLQLMTYMKAISENAGAFDADEVKPAGAFYFTMDARPIEDRKENIDPDSAVRNSMRMRGLALDDARILQKMDRSLVESPESRTMDLSYPEKKKARILTEAEFDAVLNETVEQIKAIGEDITAGRIDIQPYEAGQRSACTYCDYAHVCKDAFGFDDQKRSYPSARSAEELLMDLMNHGMDEGKEGEVDG